MVFGFLDHRFHHFQFGHPRHPRHPFSIVLFVIIFVCCPLGCCCSFTLVFLTSCSCYLPHNQYVSVTQPYSLAIQPICHHNTPHPHQEEPLFQRTMQNLIHNSVGPSPKNQRQPSTNKEASLASYAGPTCGATFWPTVKQNAGPSPQNQRQPSTN